jgi:signal transduction histidine kinase
VLRVLLDEELGPLTHDRRQCLEIVQCSVHRFLVIANNLLDASRIEAGRIELVLQPTDLPALSEPAATAST